MDEHGLPIVGTGVDYTKVPALEHKNTLVFLNTFVTQTAQFLNRFSTVCEERLGELSLRIQRLDISLNILEAKLSSIPDLEGVQATQQYEPPAAVSSAGVTSGSAPSSSQQGAPPPTSTTTATSSAPPPPSQEAAPTGEPIPPPQQSQEAAQPSGRTKAKDDPRYARYFKMKRLGVNPLQIAMEMKNHGLNPDILEDEDAEVPDDGQGGSVGAVGGAKDDSEVGSSASSSSSEESDDSFESD